MAVQIVEAKSSIMTGDELAALGDIGPSELVEGIIVPMSPLTPSPLTHS